MDINKYRRFLSEVVLTMSYSCQIVNEYSGSGECSVCWDAMVGDRVIVLSCSKNHTYHADCFMQSLVEYKLNRCPECMETLQKDDNSVIEDTSKIDFGSVSDVDLT